jgi:hypothetical protein
MMKPHLRYLRYVVLHKWYVFLAGLKVGVPVWRLVVHDWDKLLPRMWIPYVDHFYRGNSPVKKRTGYFHDYASASEAFNAALGSHVALHPHHWQHWLLNVTNETGAYPDITTPAFPMPETYVREMVADWMGASKAQHVGWDVRPWFIDNSPKMALHTETVRQIHSIFAGLYEMAGGVTSPSPRT